METFQVVQEGGCLWIVDLRRGGGRVHVTPAQAEELVTVVGAAVTEQLVTDPRELAQRRGLWVASWKRYPDGEAERVT
mgnify:CR=1 FL=1